MAIDLKKFIHRFVEEARDHLMRLNAGLAELEQGGGDAEGINALFRSAHTIKGSSRMLKLQPITETAHRLEDVLGALRGGSLAFSPPVAQVLYRGVDAIAALIDHLAESGAVESLPTADAELCALLNQTASGTLDAAAPLGQSSVTPSTIPVLESVSADAAPVAPTEAVAQEASALPPSAPAEEPRLKTLDTVRVRLEKLDELIKLMGEVVSSHARLRQRLCDLRDLEREIPDGVEQEPQRHHLRQFTRRLKDDVQAQEALMAELHDKALLMRMLPLAMVFEPAGRMVRELAYSVGKQVEWAMSGAEIELDRQLIDRLADPVVHLLRNAVDHGLETPAQRLAVGKPAPGRISLRARQDGVWVVVEVEDDGGGIPLEAVRDKAVRRGFLSAEKAALLTDQEVVDLIFIPGFSTSHIITDLSGRGVGMDVVKQAIVDDLQGVVHVSTRPGAGTTFSLRLPLSLAVMRILQVAVDGLPFGFTAQHVTELLQLPKEALLNVAERSAVIIRNELVPVVSLSELLRIPAGVKRTLNCAAKPGRGLLLVVARVRHEKLALVVDELLDERDLVIKPLPEHLRQLQVVSGVVTTGRNELVCVLHAPALLELARQARSQVMSGASAARARQAQAAYQLLVVDDSLNTREIEKEVLEAHGYGVTLAEDGIDGFNKALNQTFDAILTDVEMPNMDGFSLTAKLRGEERYRNTPIVIITSREKEEDKRRGIQVGADAYIVKGDFDQNNLVETLKSLLGSP